MHGRRRARRAGGSREGGAPWWTRCRVLKVGEPSLAARPWSGVGSERAGIDASTARIHRPFDREGHSKNRRAVGGWGGRRGSLRRNSARYHSGGCGEALGTIRTISGRRFTQGNAQVGFSPRITIPRPLGSGKHFSAAAMPRGSPQRPGDVEEIPENTKGPLWNRLRGGYTRRRGAVITSERMCMEGAQGMARPRTVAPGDQPRTSPRIFRWFS